MTQRTQRIDEQLINRLLAAIVQPLHRNKIATLDMAPWRVPVRVLVGPTTITFGLQLAYPEKDLAAALKQRSAIEAYVARVLGLRVGESLPVRVVAAGAYLLVEVAHPRPWRPTWNDVAAYVKTSVLLGIDQYNQPVSFRIEAAPPGVLVVGKSGSGKTNAMRLIAAQALANGWEIALVDLKGGRDWRRDIAPRAKWTAWDDLDAREVLETLNAILDRRNRGEVEDEPPILLVFDEFPDASEKTQQAAARIVRMGRSARIYSLIGAQRAGKREIRPAVIRSSMTTRLVGLVSNAQESADACAMPGLGADALLGKGDMLFIEDGVRVRRVQVALARPEDLVHLLRDRVEVMRPESGTALARLTFDEVLRRMEREAQAKKHPHAKPPPAWLLARTIAYIQRRGELPTFTLMARWHIQREGAHITHRRRVECREWAVKLVEQIERFNQVA